MAKNLGYIVLGLALVVVLGACNLLTVDEDESDYPTRYPAYQLSELKERNAEYQLLNNGHICSTLNEYGFTGFSKILFEEGENPCERSNREVIQIEMNNTDTLATAAKKALLKNSVYTGVTDTSALQLLEMKPLEGCINCGLPNQQNLKIEWQLTFAEQQIDSMQVPGTRITVVIDAEGVNQIWGNWYDKQDINIPDFIEYGYQDAMQIVTGTQVDMQSFTGEEQIYEIKFTDLEEPAEQVIRPFKKPDKLELRLSWAISVDHSASDFEGWVAYVDVTDQSFELVSKTSDISIVY